jgi:hypothetical protein
MREQMNNDWASIELLIVSYYFSQQGLSLIHLFASKVVFR